MTRKGSRRSLVLAGLLGAPLGLAALLGYEVRLATSREYLPDLGYEIDGTVSAAGATGPPLRLAVLGDSTAAGIGAADADGTLPVLVAERVAAATTRRVAVTGFGVSGARTADVRHSQVSALAGDRFDVVAIAVGSNDVTHLTPPWTFARSTREMLEAVRAVNPGPVVLGGIPLFGGASNLAQPLRAVVDRYAAVLRRRQEAAAASIEQAAFVDISRLASPRFRGVPEAMSADGFHPSEVGYGFWADAIAPAVVAAVTS